MKNKKLFTALFILNLFFWITPSLMAAIYVLDAFQDKVFSGVGMLEGKTLTVTYDPSTIVSCTIETTEGNLWSVQNQSGRVIDAANGASLGNPDIVNNITWAELIPAAASYAGQSKEEKENWRYLKLILDSSNENFLFCDTAQIPFKMFNVLEELIEDKVYLKTVIKSTHDSQNDHEHILYIIFKKTDKDKLKLQAIHLYVVSNNEKELVRGFQLKDTPKKFLEPKSK